MLRRQLTPGAEQCSKTVPTSGMMMHYHQCLRAAVILHSDGKPYCRQHDPVQVAKKDAERIEKYDAEWKKKARVYAREKEERRLTARILRYFELAPKLECEPVTVFGRQYVEWHRKVKKLIGRLDENKRERKALRGI